MHQSLILQYYLIEYLLIYYAIGGYFPQCFRSDKNQIVKYSYLIPGDLFI